VNPYSQPDDGWEDEPLLLLGESYQTSANVRGSPSQAVAVEDLVAHRVASIICAIPTTTFTCKIESVLGAFVVVEGEQAPTLTPLDANGHAVQPATS